MLLVPIVVHFLAERSNCGTDPKPQPPCLLRGYRKNEQIIIREHRSFFFPHHNKRDLRRLPWIASLWWWYENIYCCDDCGDQWSMKWFGTGLQHITTSH
jgi:hypothetical protein